MLTPLSLLAAELRFHSKGSDKKASVVNARALRSIRKIVQYTNNQFNCAFTTLQLNTATFDYFHKRLRAYLWPASQTMVQIINLFAKVRYGLKRAAVALPRITEFSTHSF